MVTSHDLEDAMSRLAKLVTDRQALAGDPD
jgi:hypothetical protein